jgi:diguanylate cyclase (GGDEF)-like protein
MSLHDELTGLPGRQLLLSRSREALRMAERQGARVGFLVLDPSPRNEEVRSGEAKARDRILVETARRVRRILRTTDLAGQIDAETFVVVFRGLEDEASLLDATERVMETLSSPFLDGSVRIRYRGGVALYPDHGSHAEQLLDRARQATGRVADGDADFAVYRRAGAGTAGDEGGEAPDAPLTAEAFETGFESGALELFLQPIVRIRDRKRAGWEALLRWPRPDGRIVEGEELLALAREAGMLEAVDRRVVAIAAELLGRRPGRAGPDWLSVNLTLEALTSPGFTAYVNDRIRSGGFEARRLVIDIAIREILEAPERTWAAARELRAMGLRLALDDVGSGPVPLEPLREGPVDFLKIDPVLVRDLHRSEPKAALIRGMVELGHALDAAVVAEGVESEDELLVLASVSCDYAQGFHLGEPRPRAGLTPPRSGPGVGR